MKVTILKIYAKWCGYCQSMSPEWKKMKEMLKNDTNIHVSQIEQGNIAKMNKIQQKYPDLQINGYPTIVKIYPNKNIEYYTGNRTAVDMKKWAKQINTRQTRKTKETKTKQFRNNNKTIKNTIFFGIL
jgi:thiol-disulfide isomerase/thioredoxin